ncbi:MAG: hypothetical protein JW798_00935 [Prolixibacteraceae bacterium]|nr:hypothetical protein [Prolixibacteraceae bacterium]
MDTTITHSGSRVNLPGNNPAPGQEERNNGSYSKNEFDLKEILARQNSD